MTPVQVTQAKPQEYQQIQRFLEDAYGHSRNFFPLLYPQVWREENTDYAHTLLVREDNQIVSLVRIFPMKLVLAEVLLPVAGIGGVSTLPRARGRGYMSSLMNEAIKVMDRENFPLSVLWGDRHRYRHFGYENGGQLLEVQIGPRGLQQTAGPQLPVHRYQGEPYLLERMFKLYQKNPFRKERSLKEMQHLLERTGLNTYYVEDGQELTYACFAGERGGQDVVEYGGKPLPLLTIFQHHHARFGYSSFVLRYPGPEFVPREILEAASSWWFKAAGMLKVVNLRKMLEAYRPALEKVFPRDSRLVLKRETEPAVALGWQAGKLVISSAP
ncbi:MAG TPA: GNAT family N-acetyltransferase, partial [bacterium]|nr:GNAT family N-acetyltransferase [bacterium]